LTRIKQAHLMFLISLPADIADFGDSFKHENPLIQDPFVT
jgi:hypothetical protein